LERCTINSALVGSPMSQATCVPLNTGCSCQTISSGFMTFMVSCAIEAGTAKLIARNTKTATKRIFIVCFLGVDCWSRVGLLRDFLESPVTSMSPGRENNLYHCRSVGWLPREGDAYSRSMLHVINLRSSGSAVIARRYRYTYQFYTSTLMSSPSTMTL